jgi:hypothetical protein
MLADPLAMQRATSMHAAVQWYFEGKRVMQEGEFYKVWVAPVSLSAS